MYGYLGLGVELRSLGSYRRAVWLDLFCVTLVRPLRARLVSSSALGVNFRWAAVKMRGDLYQNHPSSANESGVFTRFFGFRHQKSGALPSLWQRLVVWHREHHYPLYREGGLHKRRVQRFRAAMQASEAGGKPRQMPRWPKEPRVCCGRCCLKLTALGQRHDLRMAYD